MTVKELLENTILIALLLHKSRLSVNRIHTLMFLISNDIEEFKDRLKFRANSEGIYSSKVNTILKDLFRKRLIKKHIRFKSKIGLTPLGRKKANQVILNYPYLFTLQSFVKLIKKLSDDELLAILYYIFPKYFENVQKLERIEKQRLELAIKIYIKGKVPIDVAAKISGYNIVDFIEALHVRNII